MSPGPASHARHGPKAARQANHSCLPPPASYHYKNFIGGIFLINNDDFRRVNGLSTHFWGWGREDDELYNRLLESGLKVVRPMVGAVGGPHPRRPSLPSSPLTR